MIKDFAVISINSKQYTVEQGSTLKLDRVGESEEVDVMFAKIGESKYIGDPVLSNIGVSLEVVEELKAPKVGVRRYKSKSRYRKNKGHRQPISVVKVVDFGEQTKTELKWNIIEKSNDIESAKEKPQKDSKPKADVKEKSESLEDIGVSESMVSKLNEAGYNNVEDIKNASRDDLLEIKGIGEKAVDKLLDQIK